MNSMSRCTTWSGVSLGTFWPFPSRNTRADFSETEVMKVHAEQLRRLRNG